MPGSHATQPAPDLPVGARSALVIATATYTDPTLRQLRAPAQDAAGLGDLLADPAIGGFDVRRVVDGTAQDVRVAIEDFTSDRSPDELLLIYLSCHGLVDVRRRLYFAAADTRKDRLAATGVEAQWVLDQLEDCRARQQVVLLDCCFSGAFAQGAKGEPDLALGERFHGEGRGRVVLTASRGSEYSFEGEPLLDAAMPGSVFTSALVDGIRSGAADGDRDGFISVDDAYGYAFDRMRASDARQTPQRWLYGAEGSILLARSPAGITVAAAPLPDAVRAGLESAHPAIRAGAVTALADWLDDGDLSHGVAARQALERVAANDVLAVAAVARGLLDSDPAAAAAPPPPSPPKAPPKAAPRGMPEGPGVAGAGAPRRSRGLPRKAWYAVAAAAVAVVATLVVLNLPGQQQTVDTVTSDGMAGTITANGPWRLIIRNERRDGPNGCSVSLTREGNDFERSVSEIWGAASFQVRQGGTFAWRVNAAGCVVVKKLGGGDRTLPMTSDPDLRGDSDTFAAPRAPRKVRVEVQDDQGTTPCDLTLLDARTGQTIDFKEGIEGGPAVLLDPGENEKLYLRATTCLFRVSAE